MPLLSFNFCLSCRKLILHLVVPILRILLVLQFFNVSIDTTFIIWFFKHYHERLLLTSTYPICSSNWHLFFMLLDLRGGCREIPNPRQYVLDMVPRANTSYSKNMENYLKGQRFKCALLINSKGNNKEHKPAYLQLPQ